MGNSTKSKRPRKPYRGFPLFAHSVGQWAKKVRGKTHYFGVWADPTAAEAKWNAEKEDLLAGRTPRTAADGKTMAELTGRFMTAKQRKLDAGEIKQRTWDELYATCERLVTSFGKTRLAIDLAADDFERLRADIAEKWGPVRLGNEIQRVRSVFRYAYENHLIEKPVRFGTEFKKPARKVLRKLRAENGPRMFEAKEIRAMLGAAGVVATPIRAMILLGINCGYGNEDCATLPISALDLENGWARFPRPKTGVDRKAKLWPETIEALKQVLATRREPTEDAHKGLVFITKYGRGWSNGPKGATAITLEIRKLLIELRIKRLGLNFYGLRHSFRTVADGTRDQPAIDHVMGHARDDDMATRYREKIEDERLEAVADHVRTWLFGPKPKRPTKPKQGAEPDAATVQAAHAWNHLYETVITSGIDYRGIDAENVRILGNLSALQLHGVAKIVGFTHESNATKSAIIDGMGRRIKELLGSHERNQFRPTAEGGAK
jgi:integrase